MTEDTGQKLGIDWLKTIAGALAAVSSAVLLSSLGAAGTIIGAALGSVVVTVGGALYGQGLARSRARLAQAPIPVRRRPGAAGAEVRTSRHPGGDPTSAARADEPHGPGLRERLAMLPWKRISLGAAGLFAASVLAITSFELVAGRTVSSITGGSDGGGGTTITRLGGGSGGGPSPDDQAPTDSPTSPSDQPSDQPSPSDLASPTGPGSPTDRASLSAQPTDGTTESPSGSTSPAGSPAATPATPATIEPTLPTGPTTTP